MTINPLGDQADSNLRLYEPDRADQTSTVTAADVVPTVASARSDLARTLMQQAVIYGLASVYQYASMCASCAPTDAGGDWALNTLVHDRQTADPGYQAFRVPNVDTLYSNGWVDLSYGPVTVELPDFGHRYHTLNFLDAYSNASNVSARTHPDHPSRLILVTPEWYARIANGDADNDSSTAVFVCATPIMWLLVRIQFFGESDLVTVHELQDAIVIGAPPTGPRPWPVVSQHDVETSPLSFLTALDSALQINGAPVGDASHVHQFRHLNVGAGTPDVTGLDDAALAGVHDGFDAAMALLDSSRSLLGCRTPGGWTRVLGKGAHGSNFLARAVMNFVGLGANVVEENCSYNTYVDTAGRSLTGSDGNRYTIAFASPPPAEAFWSVTLYDAATGWLYDDPSRRHSVGSAGNDGGPVAGPTRIVIGHTPPAVDDADVDWLPAPATTFFLVLRIYQPTSAALAEEWTPPPVHPVV